MCGEQSRRTMAAARTAAEMTGGICRRRRSFFNISCLSAAAPLTLPPISDAVHFAATLFQKRLLRRAAGSMGASSSANGVSSSADGMSSSAACSAFRLRTPLEPVQRSGNVFDDLAEGVDVAASVGG